MRAVILISLVWMLYAPAMEAQHARELYINGGFLYIQPNGLLHVAGDVHIDQNASGSAGILDNDGILELRGNFYLEHSNTEQTDGVASKPGTSTGTVRFRNSGYISETSHAFESQSIIVNGGNGLDRRAFYDLELYNDNQTLSGTSDNLVSISGGDIEVKNTLIFSTDTRLRTDVDASPGTPPSGADYAWEIYVSNSSVNAIVGHSATPGAATRYVEGRLARQVSGTADYYFPVGLQPGFAGTDGMASFELRVSAAATQSVSSYLSAGETELGIPQIYCDIGDYPDAASASQPWTSCNGGPDGLYDFAHLNLDMSHEWLVENSGADFTYSIETYPGPGLDATVSSTGGNCGGQPYHLRFLAKDGALMEGPAVAAVIDPPAPFNTTNNFPIGFRLCPPLTKAQGNQLSGLIGFSRFRIHGAGTTETLLPVELVGLEARPVNNRYIAVSWRTLSELNNEGFELQRATNAVDFETIAWVDGHGTTADPQDYGYNDLDVNDRGVYYYRLKQVDFDGSTEYSRIVEARLSSTDERHFGIYPNPAPGGRFTVEMQIPEREATELFILDALGREVFHRTLEIAGDYGQIQIASDGLVPGTYNVIIAGRAGPVFADKLIILAR